MYDYGSFYRRPVRTDRIGRELSRYDVFVSAFNSSDRVQTVFTEVRSQRKIWLVHPEYQFSPVDLPPGHPIVSPASKDEVSQVDALLAETGDLRGLRVCIDTTGFMRHVLSFLLAKLAQSGVHSFTALYSEPQNYLKQEKTAFSTTTSGVVRPVRGMSTSNSSLAPDFLIIAVGYDHRLISEVANSKDNATVHPVFAFPSLSPDMYQHSALRAAQSGDIALGTEWISNRRFAPANDPFSTAQVLHEIVEIIDRKHGAANIYLSPLSTKIQTLGFALYWHLEGKGRGGVSILLPECDTYSRETSEGLRRLWTYTIEL